MSDNNPKISVVMPVYNAERYLTEAIESILNQTESDFELLIIDDGSTDHTLQIIEDYQNDNRVVLLRNATNIGVSATLNRGLREAKGKYIARMDADDIALPDRFKKQVAFLEEHRDIVLISCGMQCFGNSNAVLGEITGTDKVAVALLFNCCLGHPGYMIRADIIQKHKLRYNENNQYAEDYEFLIDISKFGLLDNYPEILMKYRVHNESVSREYKGIQRSSTQNVRSKHLEHIGINCTEIEIEVFGKAANPKPDMKFLRKEYKILKNLCKRIEQVNEEKRMFDKAVLKQALEKHLKLYKKQIRIYTILKRWFKTIVEKG